LNAKMDSNQAKEAKQEEMLAEMSARLDAKWGTAGQNMRRH
jgi:hypothetical protein